MNQPESSEPPSKRLGVVVLAAGQGTRMASPLAKVLHPVAGRTMISHVLSVAHALEPARLVVVVAPGSDEVRAAVAGATVVEQTQPLGTGHALLQTREALEGTVDQIVMLFGDGPLVRPASVRRLLAELDQAVLSLLTVTLDDPTGYGRVVRESPDGPILCIVEQAATDARTAAITEVWNGQLAAESDWLWENLARVEPGPIGEIYLTDLVAVAGRQQRRVAAIEAGDRAEAGGINTQRQLADANRIAWDREADRLMTGGVCILDPATTYVEAGVEVAAGTVLYPNTHLQGGTRIGSGCHIGPNSIVVDSTIGDRCRVLASVVEGSQLESDVRVGPYAHLRPGCYVESLVEMGNFAEAKNSRIGRGTQVHHFSYLGDADVGARVNVGAGTITCNYDGIDKHRTYIGDDAFVGSDSMLVAPLRIGARARTGAGSVVTRDVPDDMSVRGVPARAFPGNAASKVSADEPKDGD